LGKSWFILIKGVREELMVFAISVAAVAVLLCATGFMLIIYRLAHRKPETVPDLNWCRDFSVAKYRPMERLLLQDDLEFLAAQPGSNREIVRRLRAERRRIFRRYLRALSRDFDRLLWAAKAMVLHSAEDRPDLAQALVRQTLMFDYALAVVHCRLVLQGLGIGTVDVRPLVGALEAMRLQFSSVAQCVRATA
jgi:hypothetical protein